MTFFKIASGNPFDGNVVSDGVAPFTTNVLAFLRGQMFQERFERIVTVVAPLELRWSRSCERVNLPILHIQLTYFLTT